MSAVFSGIRAYETSGRSGEISGFFGLLVVWVALESLDQFMSFYRKSIYLISFCSRQQELDSTWKACIQAIELQTVEKSSSNTYHFDCKS